MPESREEDLPPAALRALLFHRLTGPERAPAPARPDGASGVTTGDATIVAPDVRRRPVDPRSGYELARRRAVRSRELVERARSAMARHDLASASAACDEALMFDPNDQAALDVQSEIRAMEERLDDERRGREERERVHRERTAALDRIVSAGESALARGELDEATRLLESALELDPRSERVAALRAEVMGRRGQADALAAAMDEAQRALAGGSVERARARLLTVLAARPESERARAILREAERLLRELEERAQQARRQADREYKEARAREEARAQEVEQEALRARAEQETRLRAEVEEEARLRAEAEEEARHRADAERDARLRTVAEQEERLRAEAEREARLRAEAERAARPRAKSERAVRDAEEPRRLPGPAKPRDERGRRRHRQMRLAFRTVPWPSIAAAIVLLALAVWWFLSR